ncbi:uncharacterized protein LOC107841371 [Capsicum annuum]|uniref:uncharacterized protein LOC107841371 n=1 Tax=Capsicum annuum TaxID=4072 RepID=UPI0007BF2E81|nr:uncharacterized protein LOC107841371 [Capsicum annuum]
MTFIKGRQIMDAVLVANEAVDSRIKQNKPGILCKLDIEKAYDHVNWCFLLDVGVLQRMGFGSKWINWIRQCISTVCFSVLINGSPTGFFKVQRGLRQGWISGFEMDRRANNSMEIAHLQYADDTSIFCDANAGQLKYLRVILILFESVSGLHINWRKSFIYPIYPINNVTDMEYLISILGGEVGILPTVYLGMPLGAKLKSKEIWNDVIERCEKKLSRWKSQYLSLVGRVTLINSVLDALPSYMMTLFPIPVSVIKRLDSIRKSFLWQGSKEKKGFYLVKWKAIIASRKKRGLGIRDLKMQSKALKLKWLWRYTKEYQMLWRKAINAKYEEEDR